MTPAFLTNLADAWDAWALRCKDRLRRERAHWMAAGLRRAAELADRDQLRDPFDEWNVEEGA